MITETKQPNRANRRMVKMQYQRYAQKRSRLYTAPALCPTCHLPFISSTRRLGRCSCKVK
jgi:hypothetical protein